MRASGKFNTLDYILYNQEIFFIVIDNPVVRSD